MSQEQNLKLACVIFAKAFKYEQNSSPVGKADTLSKQRCDSQQWV